jgi:hypothetical protein
VQSVPITTISGPSDLAIVSESSGGMVLETDPRDLKVTLARVMQLVRGRYIVEFTRPPGMEGGQHLLKVAIGQPQYFIRAAGTSMPVEDPTRQDPTVEHGVSNPSSIDQASAYQEPPTGAVPTTVVPETSLSTPVPLP